MWWLFTKKRDENNVVHTFHINNKIKTIEENIKNSFFNIKKDINKINSYIYNHDNSLVHLKERVIFLENLIKELKESKNPEKILKELPEENELVNLPKSEVKTLIIKWEDLTTIQQNIFLRLGLLQIESSQKRIAMKHLAEELYPEKSYNDVRSMISDYVNLLNEYGLIRKSRKGRQIFVTVTEKGLVFYDKNKRKRLLEIIRKNRE